MKTSAPQVCVITLGCSKNTFDSERLLSQLEGNTFSLTDKANKSDILIINTCGFIEDAKQESIQAILEGAELKRKGRLKKLLVIGCLSERYKHDLLASVPEVDKFFGVMDAGKEMLTHVLEEIDGDYKHHLVGERRITTPSHYAYMKISEGCDNPCSFCAIPLMRGGHKSRPQDTILNEAKILRKKGVKEINLIAQDLTYYGLDLYNHRSLNTLLELLATMTDPFERIRILYAYPAKFPLNILPVIHSHDNICKYIDIPIQHANNDVLKSMRRGITQERLVELFSKIKETVPDIRLRTTLIIGYPNETDIAFQELCDFVRNMRFDRLGCFTYSQEENTTAFELGDPIPRKEKERRLLEIMSIQEEISKEKNEALIGTELNVMIDRIENGEIVGRTEFDAPEIDHEFYIHTPDNAASLPTLSTGDIVKAKVTDAEAFDLFGEIVYDPK